MSKPSEMDKFGKEPNLTALSEAYDLVKKEPERARTALENLAEQGSLMSMVYLGDIYLKGIGVPPDSGAAEKWFVRATDGGSRIAPHQLGLLYLTSKDFQRAEEMFRLGATWDYPPSLYRLGTMYADGVGVAKQPILARGFFERASSQGHVFAKRRLAGLLLQGADGPIGILKGLWLFSFGLAEATVGAALNPNSERMRS